jgi:hypothetical protein
VATGGNDGNVMIWHAETGRRVATLRSEGGEVLSIQFGTDSKQLLTTSRFSAYVHACPECVGPSELGALAHSRVIRQLTADERSSYGVPTDVERAPDGPPPADVRDPAPRVRHERGALAFRTWMHGEVSPFDEDTYTIEGRTGQHVGVAVRTAPDSDLDPYVLITGPDGRTLAEDDDGAYSIPKFQPWDAAVELILPAAGRYTVTVRTVNGRAGRYAAVAETE